MANKPGREKPPHWRKGDRIRADDLNILGDAAIGRLVASGDLGVESTPHGAIVRGRRSRQPRPAPNTIVAMITGPYEGEDAEAGEYLFELWKGSGPAAGRCIELAGTTGIPAETKVVLRRAGGIWYFSYSSSDARAQITAVDAGGDSLTCMPVDSSGAIPEDAEALVVALPRKLQKTPWHGEANQVTIPGPFTIRYNYTSAQTRTATHIGGPFSGAQHTEVIIPAYLVGDIIVVGRMEQVVGSVTYTHYDKNNDARQWARRGVS